MLFFENHFNFNNEHPFGLLSGVPEQDLEAFKIVADSWDTLIKKVLWIDQTYDQKYFFVTVEWHDGVISYHPTKTAYAKFPKLVSFNLI